MRTVILLGSGAFSKHCGTGFATIPNSTIPPNKVAMPLVGQRHQQNIFRIKRYPTLATVGNIVSIRLLIQRAKKQKKWEWIAEIRMP